jgi:GDP-4-dehydro-6-deoxy-D-mannose reductase
MRVLITGINGFVGSYLAEYILSLKVHKVFGTVRRRSNTDNLSEIKDKIKLIECDLRDSHSIDRVINQIKPDKIFHLAAQSFVPTSWKIPSETFESNILGTLNLFEAVRIIRNYKPVIQIACSSEEYGLVMNNEVPITEDNPLRPLSPYAVSKVAQDMLGYQYYMSYGMNIVRTRAFNHSGARRPADFVDSGFARQIALVEKKKLKFISHGNLEAIRDFTDVRDIVRAYWLATEFDELYGEVVNIASGSGVVIGDILERLNLKKYRTYFDKDKARPSDVPILIGDSTKLRKITGWKPEFDYMTITLADMLNYWRMRV